jgi:hypothetical protein
MTPYLPAAGLRRVFCFPDSEESQSRLAAPKESGWREQKKIGVQI